MSEDTNEPAVLAPEEVASKAKRAKMLAKAAVRPAYRHSTLIGSIAAPLMGELPGQPADVANAVVDAMEATGAGDLKIVSQMLTAQALTLDSLFTEFTHRAVTNMGQHPHAFDRYAKLALKAQANSRATLEALARLHQPREQIVKHVTVHEGGQAVVADQFHHHTHGGENEKNAHQAHAAPAVGGCPALSSSDASGTAMPIPSDAKRALSHARREIDGSTER